MTHPEFTCSHCGSGELRRSRSTSLHDLRKIVLGKYPFRCLVCKERIWIDLYRKGGQARCPRCLSASLASVAHQHIRFGFWKRQLLRLGARAYRCSFCGLRFASFKKLLQRVPENTAETHPAPERPREMASAAGAGR